MIGKDREGEGPQMYLVHFKFCILIMASLVLQLLLNKMIQLEHFNTMNPKPTE